MSRAADSVDPAKMRAAVQAVAEWISDSTGEVAKPPRAVLGEAVRLSVRTLTVIAPGHSVEVRVPPFAAVQCVDGPRHTRGTPPNVVETDPRTWLRVAAGLDDFDALVATSAIDASGSRATEIGALLPLLSL